MSRCERMVVSRGTLGECSPPPQAPPKWGPRRFVHSLPTSSQSAPADGPSPGVRAWKTHREKPSATRARGGSRRWHSVVSAFCGVVARRGPRGRGTGGRRQRRGGGSDRAERGFTAQSRRCASWGARSSPGRGCGGWAGGMTAARQGCCRCHRAALARPCLAGVSIEGRARGLFPRRAPERPQPFQPQPTPPPDRPRRGNRQQGDQPPAFQRRGVWFLLTG
jgi:hypothetical protein